MASLYAAASRGVFKSTDAVTTWDPTGLVNTATSALAIDPMTGRTLYAGGDGLSKSTDAGVTWAATSLAPEFDIVYTVAIDPGMPGTLYAGTSNGVSESTDAGATWAATGLMSPAEIAPRPVPRLTPATRRSVPRRQ
jgi:hypothetical protein